MMGMEERTKKSCQGREGQWRIIHEDAHGRLNPGSQGCPGKSSADGHGDGWIMEL